MYLYTDSKSDGYQESYVLTILEEKKNGYYLELGSADPFEGNNTSLLESKFGWKGLALDTDEAFVKKYNEERRNECIAADALTFDYKKYFEENNFPKEMDYLQIDIDGHETNNCLLALLADKTAWELSMKDIIDMSRQRGYFIDQSQSLNLFMENANFSKLTSMHFYAWKSGLKTGMYYLRTKAATDAIKFTLDNTKKAAPVEITAEAAVKTAKPDEKSIREQEVDVQPLSEDEMRDLIAKAKEGQADDDCLMCGS